MSQPELNLRPLIGILSQVVLLRMCLPRLTAAVLTSQHCCLQPGTPAPQNHSYIAASYIKFVEVRSSCVHTVQPCIGCGGHPGSKAEIWALKSKLDTSAVPAAVFRRQGSSHTI